MDKKTEKFIIDSYLKMDKLFQFINEHNFSHDDIVKLFKATKCEYTDTFEFNYFYPKINCYITYYIEDTNLGNFATYVDENENQTIFQLDIIKEHMNKGWL